MWRLERSHRIYECECENVALDLLGHAVKEGPSFKIDHSHITRCESDLPGSCSEADFAKLQWEALHSVPCEYLRRL